MPFSFLFRCTVITCLTAVLPGFPAFAATSDGHYRLAREVPLPNDGGWDYLVFAPEQNRLFVTHDSTVLVLDGDTLAVVGSIADVPGSHGIAIATDLKRGYITSGRARKVTVFDLQSLERLTDIEVTGDNPDAVLYDQGTHQVFTFNGRGRNVTVIDARTNRVTHTIAVDAKPEFAVNDGKGRVFVNLEDRNSIAVIDAAKVSVIATWPLKDCEDPSGLALDREHHRLFSVCGNRRMAVIDAKSGKSIANVPIGAYVDGVVFDAAAGLAFASGGDGTLTVVHQDSPDRYSVRETVVTKPGARTLARDPKRDRIYSVTAKFLPVPADQPPGTRPVMEPDSFELLVIEP